MGGNCFEATKLPTGPVISAYHTLRQPEDSLHREMVAGILAFMTVGVDGGVAGDDAGRGKDPVDPRASGDRLVIAMPGAVVLATLGSVVPRIDQVSLAEHGVVDARAHFGRGVEVAGDDPWPRRIKAAGQKAS